MAERINWRQAGAEVALLFCGAAVALAADRWMDARNDRVEEQEYLVALRSDFETTRSNLDAILDITQVQAKHNNALIETLSGPQAHVPTDSIIGMLQVAFTTLQPEPVLATFQDMVNSGSLGLIQSDELRRKMASLVGGLASSQWVFDETVRHYSDRVTPYFQRHLSVPAIYHQSPMSLRSDEVITLGSGTSVFEPSLSAVWDGQLANLVATHALYIGTGNGALVEHLQRIDVILGLIDRETRR